MRSRRCGIGLIHMPIIRNLPINLPSAKTQKRIAGVLHSYDKLIENTRKQIRLLEEAAQRLYKEWFIDLKFPDHETAPINPETNLPKGWRTGQLSEIAELVFGQSPKSEFYNNSGEGLPFHQGVKGYSDRFVVNETYTSQWKREAKSGSILFSVRAPVGSINLTKARIAIGRGLAAINSKYHTQSFLLYLLKEKFYKKDLMGNGSIYASINSDTLKTIECIIPDIRVIELFEKHVSCIDSEIWTRDEEICRLQEARDRLLPKLMSGEIEVI